MRSTLPARGRNERRAAPAEGDRLGSAVIENVMTDLGKAGDLRRREDLPPAREEGVVETEIAPTPDYAYRM